MQSKVTWGVCLVSLSCAHIRRYDTTLCHRFKCGIFLIYWIKHRDFLKFSSLNLLYNAYVRTRWWQFVDRCLTWGCGCVYHSYCNVMSLFLSNVNNKMPIVQRNNEYLSQLETDCSAVLIFDFLLWHDGWQEPLQDYSRLNCRVLYIITM